ncbi:class I SAM-dependent methyltransferase [Desulfosporosinus sp. BG]|uniref:class I SAM-dependent methyltransferase n=1 Tax=Desulfosporosinus sp. BG TaxID=1633135 RepID=UPI00083A2549|nr:class I SAM-dependent methyltransferase [Desulfosporosinus sp. BG]ODA42873.1 putative methyltransferase [Desulfosporosinus sp. BG]
MDAGMLALLGKTTALMEHLGFLWVVQTGMELNLWAELERDGSIDDLMALHPGWDKILLDHWLEQAYCQDLLIKNNGYFRVTKLGKAINKYRNSGLEALYKELVSHWGIEFAELPQLITNQKEKLAFGSDMEEELISKASLASEPFVWPFLRSKCQREKWQKVLDLGCGEGLYLNKLACEFPLLHGVGLEMNPVVASRAQERAKETGGRIHILCEDILSLRNLHDRKQQENELLADAERLLDESGTFDLCLLNNSIYYFTPEQRIQLLESIKGLLTPGGQVGILTAVRKGEPIRVFRTHVPQNLMSFFLACHQGFQGLPTEQEILTLLQQTGYTDVNISVMPLGTSHYFFAKCSHECSEMSR